MNVTVDYLPKKDYCRFEIDDLDVFDRLREEFSVPNEAKKFVKGPNRRFIPDRIYTLFCFKSRQVVKKNPVLTLTKELQAVILKHTQLLRNKNYVKST
jgi:hypothetical protein